ncbi:MAG: hypothetical protein ACREB8_03550 [Pseudolabrys sp.]
MELDLSTPTALGALIGFTKAGAKAGCPFCAGRLIASVSSGERIIILKGMYAGRKTTVSDQAGFSKGEFLVKFDSDPPTQLTRVIYKSDTFAGWPLPKIPDWLCCLSIDDLCSIDESALKSAVALANESDDSWSGASILPLVATVRARRLPVLGADLWPTLEAHGLAKIHQDDFCKKFDYGVELLVALHGRPAIKKNA